MKTPNKKDNIYIYIYTRQRWGQSVGEKSIAKEIFFFFFFWLNRVDDAVPN